MLLHVLTASLPLASRRAEESARTVRNKNCQGAWLTIFPTVDFSSVQGALPSHNATGMIKVPG